MARRFSAGDYMTVPSPSSYNLLTASVDFWFRGTNDSSNTIFNVSRSSAGDFNIAEVTIGGNRSGGLTNEIITFVRRDDTDSFYDVLGYTTSNRAIIFDGVWHHIALTFSGSASGTKIYLDGQSQTVTVGVGSNAGKFGHVSLFPLSATVGAFNNAGTIQLTPGGNELSFLSFRNVSLSAAEVAALAACASPLSIRPSSLVSLWVNRGLAADTIEVDVVRGRNLTIFGTPSWAPDPPVSRLGLTNVHGGLPWYSPAAMIAGQAAAGQSVGLDPVSRSAFGPWFGVRALGSPSWRD